MPYTIILTSRLLILISFASVALVSTLSVSAAADKKVMHLDPKLSAAQYIGCLDAQQVTLVSAHRGGARAGFPENALESLQATLAYGPMLLEVDVRETADGQLVLMHDATLARTSNGTGDLADFSLAELSDIRLRDPQGKMTSFSIPTLVDVLNWADDRTIVQLDVKRGVDFAKVAQAVVDADAVDSTILIAYRIEDAAAALKVSKNLSFSLSINRAEDLQALKTAGIALEQIVAWTGVVRQLENPIWPVSESLDIPSAAGALWDLEEKIIASGDPQPYIQLAKNGIDIIATDHYQLAYDTLAKQQDLAAALLACKGN